MHVSYVNELSIKISSEKLLTMKKLLPHLKQYRLFVILAPIFMLGEVIGDLSVPKLMSGIIDNGVIAGNMNVIIENGLLMLLCAALGGLFGVLCCAAASYVVQGFAADLRADMYKRIIHLSFEQTDSFTTGSLITRMSSDINQLKQFIEMSLRGFIRSVMLFFGGIIMLISLDTRFGVVALAALPIEAVIMIIALKKAFPLYKAVQVKLDNVNEIVSENINGARTIKSFVREDYEEARFETANEDLTDKNYRVLSLLAKMNPLLHIVMSLSVALIILIGGYSITPDAEFGVGEIMAAVTYITQILHSMMMMANMFQTVSRANASAMRINEIFDIEPAIIGGEITAKNLTEGSVRFENVRFSYPGSGAETLKGISLTIKPGEHFAILGATGSGKSTFASLIPRFYDTTGGNIYVNRIDTRDYTLEALRDKIGIVMQKTELFSISVADNISHGKPGASMDEIITAAAAAQADEFISLMENGYETVIAEKGFSMSGGQKQRISIARAIIKKPEILIFDDSTSALDLATEKRLSEAIKEHCQGTTVIKVAQRINSIIHCDRIAVIDNGMIDSIGTHEELMLNSEIYREIYNSQNRVPAADEKEVSFDEYLEREIG
ncbi:MAG: ABC transporter ATP-binding protein/permease [Ruminococcus sp.]|jgi:ATP-binding cassette subfamily B protein|nr:ABC transporter ATP-binding protein/permease [Ruminococcus sp.]